jgi:hypothetical protein
VVVNIPTMIAKPIENLNKAVSRCIYGLLAIHWKKSDFNDTSTFCRLRQG